jgi:hypothetical protein
MALAISGSAFEGEFFSQPSYERYLCFGNDCVVVCKYLLDSCLLILYVDRVGRGLMWSEIAYDT